MMTHERRNQKCNDDSSERQAENVMMMAIKAENSKCDSERQTENVMIMALNAETEKQWWWLWTTKLKMW